MAELVVQRAADIPCWGLAPRWAGRPKSPVERGNPVVPQEDQERAHSRLRAVTLEDDTCVWTLEVREQYTVGSVRWGTVRLHGSWDGALTISLTDLTGAAWYRVEP